jgi:murein DD-endopeptidase MepM/ murein hydrolase activator NlpD
VYRGQELLIPGDGPGLLPEPFLYVEVQPLPVVQGSTQVIEVHTTKPVSVSGSLFGQNVRFGEEGGVYFGLVGVHVFAEPGLYELLLTAEDGEAPGVTIAIGVLLESGRFGYERIPASGYQSSLLDPAIVAAERERLTAATQVFSAERGWEGAFLRPCVGTVSSYFGTRRSYGSGPYTSYHNGLDLRAPTGTPVYAAAAGSVTLAELTAIHGNMIVIDHGWGVLTGYAHLSSIAVEVGQLVAEGELIGKVGNTGLSTGSHLHWQVWVGGTSVDGRQWLEGFNTWPSASE